MQKVGRLNDVAIGIAKQFVARDFLRAAKIERQTLGPVFIALNVGSWRRPPVQRRLPQPVVVQRELFRRQDAGVSSLSALRWMMALYLKGFAVAKIVSIFQLPGEQNIPTRYEQRRRAWMTSRRIGERSFPIRDVHRLSPASSDSCSSHNRFAQRDSA